MIRLSFAAMLCCGVAVAPPVAAQAYLGASVGFSRFDNPIRLDQAAEFPMYERHDDDVGFKLYAGYKFNPYLAVEGGYLNLGKVNLVEWKSRTDSANHGNISQQAAGAVVWALGILPIGQFELFGKLGAVRMKTTLRVDNYGLFDGIGSSYDTHQSSHKWSTDLAYGIGAGYSFSPNWSARLEWESFRTQVLRGQSKLDLISAGISYRF